MFFKKLYRYNKTGCFVVIVFLLAYIYINAKWGVVATPVLQFGMYSSPFHIKDTQEIYMVKANQKMINCAELSFNDRDIVQLFLHDYERQLPVNTAVYNTMHNYSGLQSLMSYKNFTNHISDTAFTHWYKRKLERIIGEPIDLLSVFKQDLVWQLNGLQASGTPIKINFIVP